MSFANDRAAADYRARVERLVAAFDLREPDRVPVSLKIGWWPAVDGGMTPYEATIDPERAAEAWVAFNTKYPSDTMVAPPVAPPSMLETLDYRLYSWPGHGVPEESGYQYVEREWMLPEEYDQLIADPSRFMLRTYLPRVVGAFSAFRELPSLLHFVELPFILPYLLGWGSPRMVDSLRRITAAASDAIRCAEIAGRTVGRLVGMGFPSPVGGGTKAPFDILGDTLRGTKGILTDMFRRPQEVLAACERLVPVAIDLGLGPGGPQDAPLVMLPLHKGADGFMSDEQFERFYWPTLREVLIGLIDEGATPCCFAEGRYTSRLETIMDLPRGKTVWAFDQTDMAQAKRTIGRVACIQGNVPLSLMHAGTPVAVADHVRRLIEIAGEGGGYIVDLGAVADSGRTENLEALLEAVAQYGTY